MLNALYKGLFPNLYKVLVSISFGGAPLDDCWLNIDFVLELEGPPSIHPSIESSNSLSEIYPPRISCHASCFSESVPSVSQSRFAIKRESYFRLGRSRHSRNSPVHRSITRVRIQSAHSERKKRSSWILFLNQNVYQLISGQSLHGVFTPLYWEVHHVDRNRQRPSCTRPRGQHSWQSSLVSPEGMVWLCFVLGIV